MNNFLPLSRDISNHWLWREKPFSKGQAWIDLLILANYEDFKKPYKGEVITCRRGDVDLSISEISIRWGWDRKSVRRFLKLLEKDGMVCVNSTTHRTTVTIVNYGYFNVSCPTSAPTNAQQVSQLMPNQCPASAHNKEKEENKEGEEKELYTDCSVFSVSDKSDTTKTTQSVRQTDVRRAVEAWNNLTEYGVPPVSKMVSTSKRYEMLSARIGQYGIDDVLRAIEKIKSSDFLQGKKTDFLIKFDWFVRPNNFPKVLDGNYDDKQDAADKQDDGYDPYGDDFPGYIQL